VHIISKRKLRNYWGKNSQAELPLTEWYFKMKEYKAQNLAQLRKTFNSVDLVHGYTVFNIGGNNYRLIAAVHYNTQRCYVRAIWNHTEYSKRMAQDKLKRGEL
jgi:mRNA interferase HigB